MDEDHATATLPPLLQLGITFTASLCITAAHCRQSANFSNGPRIKRYFLQLFLKYSEYLPKYLSLNLQVKLYLPLSTKN
jgi:hypothetical protein